jgi:ribosome-binding factor A
MDDIRSHRISEAIREELTEIIDYEMSDPRVEGVTITDVHIAADGKRARVMVSLADAADREHSLAALDHARAFLRTQVAHRLALRRMPDLAFELDSVVNPERLNSLMRRIRKGRPRD